MNYNYVQLVADIQLDTFSTTAINHNVILLKFNVALTCNNIIIPREPSYWSFILFIMNEKNGASR